MKKLLFLLCFFAVDGSYSQQVVYPLHVGEIWEYWEDYGGYYSFTSKITSDTLMPNGKKYFVVIDFFFGPTSYQRQEGDSVFQYFDYLLGERLLYDFSRSIGDTISSYPSPYTNLSDTTDIILINSGMVTIFGKERRLWNFLIDDLRHGVDDEEIISIADSIGVTYISCFCNPIYLRGATINGTHYGTITDVPSISHELPISFALSQNYPNPFNPTTTISFDISQKSFVTLKVYDMLGREVATVVNQELTPDSYTKEYNANSLSSGVYVYRLTALHDNRLSVFSQKMLLLK